MALLSNRFGKERAHDLLHGCVVIIGDPFSQFHELGSDKWFGVDELINFTEGEIGGHGLADFKYRASGGTIAEGDFHSAPSDSGHPFWNGVVKNELGWAVDEDTGCWHVLFLNLSGL